MTQQNKICVVGLGYVGLPLIKLFAKHFATVGYDTDHKRIEQLEGTENIFFTDDINEVGKQECNFYVVAVPTPVDNHNRPDLQPLLSASQAVGSVIRRGDIVVYESTVYPGMTEDVCVPQIEAASGLRFNEDFFVGYSPERVNPSDVVHQTENICKVVSGSTPEVAKRVTEIYGTIIDAGIHTAPSIRVAEAAKLLENTQRDVNIALINEVAKLFAAMGISTADVLAAARTKWNFVDVRPGLVGGHCIGVDPYYLIEKAREYDIVPNVVVSARQVNDNMGIYVAEESLKLMEKRGLTVSNARMLILGFTFKENCPDVRNTRVADIYKVLSKHSQNVEIYDPVCDPNVVNKTYGIDILTNFDKVGRGCYSAVIVAVAHKEFKDIDFRSLLVSDGIIYDVKGICPPEVATARL